MNAENRNELLDKKALSYIKERFCGYYGKSQSEFRKAKENYLKLKPFAPDGNIWESDQEFNDNAHLFMRLLTQYYKMLMMDANLIDLNNGNVKEDLSVGNIGTFGRVAKVACGYDTHDDSELGSGRWMKPIRLAKFPNNSGKRLPITKKVSLVSSCSHHEIVFESLTDENGKVIISYIPDKFVLGISKLSRLVRYISRRYYLQEDLTKRIYEEISKAAETEDVYVGLYNIRHGCEFFRGIEDEQGGFSTEYYGGAFKDPALRNQVKNS